LPGVWTYPDTSEFGMADVINLRTARKQKKRQLEEQAAAAHRLSSGRSKSERALDNARKHKASRTLDQHRIETGADR
jgi:hypothetical protein